MIVHGAFTKMLAFLLKRLSNQNHQINVGDAFNLLVVISQHMRGSTSICCYIAAFQSRIFKSINRPNFFYMYIIKILMLVV